MLCTVSQSMVILPPAKTWIRFIGACIMQRKQAFTTTQSAQSLGIKHYTESEASELIAGLTQIY